VHVFSRPCDLPRIDDIARRKGLKVIYDAAHATGVEIGGRSIMAQGDVSCASFHATKIFNTCEGGACVSADASLMARIRRMRFFGFDERKEIVDGGMNAKMTEVSAALGLANLPHLPAVMAERRRKYTLYQDLLAGCGFVTFQQFSPSEYNYSYMPVLFDTEARLLAAEGRLLAEGIMPRRYFYPSLHELKVFGSGSGLPHAERVARTILCLPLYTGLPEEDIQRISRIVRSTPD
jgi:dTDP-4-amino-4,6-dideoxygalactose transaminase